MSLSSPPAPATPPPTGGVSAATIDASCRWPLLGLYYGAAFWLVLSATAYLVASLSFHAPALFADAAALSYGRMAPVAGNLLVYGFCIPAGWASVLWMLARLGGTPLAHGAAVMIGGKLWHLGVLLGTIGILAGDGAGFEALEFPLYAAWPLLLGAVLIGVSGLNTLGGRREREMHPVHWFGGLGVLWFPWIYLSAVMFLQVWPVRGMAQGAVHWWYLAQLQVVLLGLCGVASLFYFFPLFSRRPLPSRQLALFTLLTLLVCGGWAGVPLTAPAPAWLSVLSQVMAVSLMMPVLAILLNLWPLRSVSTVPEGRFLRFGAAALMLWTALTVAGSGSGLWRTLGFTLVQPALTQLLVQGFAVMVALGAAYYVLPRISGRALPWPMLARAHFWLAAAGLILVVLPFIVGGLKQAGALADPSIPFTAVADGTLMPIRLASMGQLLLVLGHGLLGVNVLGLVIGLVRARLAQFDNTPVGMAEPMEGGA